MMKGAAASTDSPEAQKAGYIRLYSIDGHEMILGTKFCRHSNVIMNMISPPGYGDLIPEDATDEPSTVKTLFQSSTLALICWFLMFKFHCRENGFVGEFTVEPEMALMCLEAANFFNI